MGTSTDHSLTIDCVWAPIVKAMLVGGWSVLVLGDQSTICIHLWSGVSRCDRVVVDQLILSGVSRWDGWATLRRRAPPEPPEAKWEALQWAQWAVKRPQVSPPALCPHPPQGEWKWSNLAYIIPHASKLPFKLEKFLQIPSNMNWKYNILLDIEANICTLSPNFLVCGNFQQTGRPCKNKSLLCSDLMVFWSVG